MNNKAERAEKKNKKQKTNMHRCFEPKLELNFLDRLAYIVNYFHTHCL